MTASRADQVRAGLAPVRDPRPIRPDEAIHVVGAGGAGASAAAWLAATAGAQVTACDAAGPSPYTAALEALGITVVSGHAAVHVTTPPIPHRLAVTKALTAIDPDHPELAAAREVGIPVESWQQVVADAATGRRLVGVAGTHGKSTTAGWLVHVLASAGLHPSAFVGALLPGALTGGPPGTAVRGDGPDFVVEADEYAGNFEPYRPNVAVLTGAEWDHPDVFADLDEVVEAFAAWLRNAPAGATLVANVGDAGAAAVVERLADWPGSLVAYALVDQAPQRLGSYARGIAERFGTAGGPTRTLLGRITSTRPGSTGLELHGLDSLTGATPVTLRTAGRHNAANALAVAGAAWVLGVAPEAIAAGLATFDGVGRRLERVGEAGGVVVYDDYGHHPSAIRATLAAVRQREPERRVWAVYEPLTFHRTAALLDAFADVLATADGVAVADIWAGRDPDQTIASASGLADAVRARNPGIPVEAPGSVEQTADRLAGLVRPGDAVLVMGGGRSYQIGPHLLARLTGT